MRPAVHLMDTGPPGTTAWRVDESRIRESESRPGKPLVVPLGLGLELGERGVGGEVVLASAEHDARRRLRRLESLVVDGIGQHAAVSERVLLELPQGFLAGEEEDVLVDLRPERGIEN